MHGVGSRNKLTPSHARHYPGAGLLDVLGRALCAIECLPRKELHEAFEMATVVRARFRGGRVVDLCCGQGLLAWCMLLLDDTASEAVAVDVRLPANHGRVEAAVVTAFPHLAGRVRFQRGRLEDVALRADDVVVSAHPCGPLTDAILARAVAVGARVAVLPCCHRTRVRTDLAGTGDIALAIDRERVGTLRGHAQRVWTCSIPPAISPHHRVLLAAPSAADHDDVTHGDGHGALPWPDADAAR